MAKEFNPRVKDIDTEHKLDALERLLPSAPPAEEGGAATRASIHYGDRDNAPAAGANPVDGTDQLPAMDTQSLAPLEDASGEPVSQPPVTPSTPPLADTSPEPYLPSAFDTPGQQITSRSGAPASEDRATLKTPTPEFPDIAESAYSATPYVAPGTAAPLSSEQVIEPDSADLPTLVVENSAGNEDTAIALDITSALTDTDGSETLSVTISDVPDGA
ncbi:MAG: hypothetical protein KTR19_08380, partial [Hyphomicrobiales bacterium]|nr:hypothetical protein [Hyphomicrobiales bacterium]